MNDWREVPVSSTLKASLLIVHGAGEHYSRHLELAHTFARAGYYVGMGDLPGYGRAKGRRGHIENFQEYVDTVQTWAERLGKQCPSVPRFIFGHSLGGLVTARLIEQQKGDRWNGVILSSPCFGLTLAVPGWKKRLARVLEYVWPTLRFKSGIDSGALCRNPEVRRQYQTDPLVVKKVSVKWYWELQKALTLVHEDVDRFCSPVLILQGGEDRVVDPAATRRWYDRVPVDDKHLIWVEDGYHELLQDFGKEELMKKLVAWADSRIKNDTLTNKV